MTERRALTAAPHKKRRRATERDILPPSPPPPPLLPPPSAPPPTPWLNNHQKPVSPFVDSWRLRGSAAVAPVSSPLTFIPLVVSTILLLRWAHFNYARVVKEINVARFSILANLMMAFSERGHLFIGRCFGTFYSGFVWKVWLRNWFIHTHEECEFDIWKKKNAFILSFKQHQVI